jgi:hypothetical protein
MRETQSDRSSLAAAVWMSTVAYCAGLAAAAMLTSLVIQLASDFNAGFAVWSVVFIGTAAIVGWVIGAIVGIPLGLVVTLGHDLLGRRAIAVLLPLVALGMTALVVYGWIGVRSPVAMATAASLTLLGGVLIAARYERLARGPRVH